MANPTSFPGDLIVAGTARINDGISPPLPRASVLAITELAQFTIPWTWWRIWNSTTNDRLPGAAVADDLALVPGTFGTGSPSIQGSDFGGMSLGTTYARAQIPLPWEYSAGQTVILRFHAGMLTTVSSDYARLDVECYETDEEAGIGSDICFTGVQSINSLTLADLDFVITATGLVAGDLLDVRIAVSGNDATDLGVMKPIIGAVKLLCDVR